MQLPLSALHRRLPRSWPQLTALVRRTGRRLEKRGRGLAVGARALPYRPAAFAAPTVWDARYAANELDHLANEVESARTAVLAELLVHVGGEPAILEIGCGVGLFRTRLDVVPFRRYVGIDVSAVAIAKAAPLADERTAFQVADRPNSALGRFDVVVANDVLNCVADPAGFLDDIVGVVHPGGHLLSSVWRHPGDIGLHRLIAERFVPLHTVEIRDLSFPYHRWWVACHRLPVGPD